MIADAQSPSRRIRKSVEPQPEQALRLPEDRAFDVATINLRLARMAERAAPRRSGRSPDC
jgi:hypothetical protein